MQSSGTHGGSGEAWEGASSKVGLGGGGVARPGVRVSVMGVEWEAGPPQTTQEQAAWVQLVQIQVQVHRIALHCRRPD